MKEDENENEKYVKNLSISLKSYIK